MTFASNYMILEGLTVLSKGSVLFYFRICFLVFLIFIQSKLLRWLKQR
jgi:hypothetical protein